jgi:hypothetical protein
MPLQGSVQLSYNTLSIYISSLNTSRSLHVHKEVYFTVWLGKLLVLLYLDWQHSISIQIQYAATACTHRLMSHTMDCIEASNHK